MSVHEEFNGKTLIQDKKIMNVLSLFDGMSCGQIALKQLGIIPEVYYASEIDKHAIKQTQLNFPNTIQLGDVTRVDVSQLEPIDLLIGGSPCQSFSFAGKRVGMSTTDKEEIYTLERYLELKEEGFQFEGESYLFWEYMRILTDIRQYNPNVLFLLENVEMGKKWERVLSEAIGVYGVHINSALVSAQNRRRIYWTNIRTRNNGLFGELHSDIPQPEDKGIFLRDILKDEVDEKYYVTSKCLEYITKEFRLKKGYTQIDSEDKALPLMARGCTNWTGDYIRAAMRGREDGKQHLEPQITGKTNCLTSVQKDNLILQRSRGNNAGGIFEGKTPTLSACAWEQNNLLCERQRRNYKSQDEKANAFLSTSHKGSQANGMTLVRDIIQLNPSKDSGGVQPYQQDRIYDVNGIAPALCSGHGGMGCNINTDRIRRLTPIECARLQTIPSWYKWECSDTQQYRMLGNGWTVDVIAHILSFIKEKLNINVA